MNKKFYIISNDSDDNKVLTEYTTEMKEEMEKYIKNIKQQEFINGGKILDKIIFGEELHVKSEIVTNIEIEYKG